MGFIEKVKAAWAVVWPYLQGLDLGVRTARDWLADWSQRHKNKTAFLLIAGTPFALIGAIATLAWFRG